jgi:biopolymer transport protein ExbD
MSAGVSGGAPTGSRTSGLGSSRLGSRRGGMAQDFELNLAPIIDCFTVLIAFMLASASFLAIGIFDAGANAAGAAASQSQAPDPVSIQVEIKGLSRFEVRVTSGKSTSKSEFNTRETLRGELNRLKKEWPQLQTATLSADDSVEYKEVILTLAELRSQFPATLLGGFSGGTQ